MRIKSYRRYERGDDETDIIVNDYCIAKVCDTAKGVWRGNVDKRYRVFFNPVTLCGVGRSRDFVTFDEAESYIKATIDSAQTRRASKK